MAVTVKPLITIKSLCGKTELSKGELCQVCWTDGRGRMTVWGYPRAMFGIADFVLVGFSQESDEDLRVLARLGLKQEKPAMLTVSLIEQNLAARIIEAASANYTTIEVCFVNDSRRYTYKVGKDKNLEAGKVVIVNSPRSGYTAALVMEVHESPRLLMDVDYKWIVSVVDDTEYKQIMEYEAEANKVLLAAREKDRHTERMQKIMGLLPDNSATRQVAEEIVKSITDPQVAA